jgi:hypothetical protein
MLLVASLLCVALTAGADGAPGVTNLNKKLIEYGWDVPTPEFIRAHLAEMEQHPFDGLIFRLKGGTNVLDPTPWDEAVFAADYDHLEHMEWKTFTDNFVSMLAASNQDWFDDGQWAAILHNTVLVAKAGRLGRCVGVCFDPEPYGANPWSYKESKFHDTKSFDEYWSKVRERGAQFMRAIQQEMPNPKILSFYQFGMFNRLCRPMPPAERMKDLSEHSYAFLPPFLNGMLEAADPGARFIDGNENAYYYESEAPYFEAYHRITQGSLYLVDPALWAKYRAQARVGQALYVDQYFGLRAEKVLGYYMTPEERPKWFEHNTYWALSSSDEYVWCYSEKMDWWKNVAVPPGAEDALRRAREKVSAGAPLDFDLKPMVETAHQREQQK